MISNNTDKSAVKVTMISTNNIIHDLVDCLTTSKGKIAKRTARLRTVLDLKGEDPDTFIGALKILEEQNTVITDQEIVDYLAIQQETTYDPVVFDKDKEIDDRVKKAIEAELTSGMNSDGYLYKVTCRNLTHVLWEKISRNRRFKALCKDRRIILVHKGGVAMRHALRLEYPDKHDVIDESFRLGGDNDVCLMIDPTLVNFNEVHKELCQYVHDFLNSEVWGFGEGHIATITKKLRHIKVGGIYMKVSPDVRQSFTIRTLPNGDKVLLNSPVRLPVFTSYNELSFKDEIGRTAEFTLVRARRAVRVTPINSEVEDIKIPIDHPGCVFSAEAVDITLPTQKDEKHVEGFEHYRSGLWANFNAMV